MKKLIIGICIMLLAMQHTTAQDVQIDGKAFQTVKKTVLNTEIEYYQVKEKANAASKSQSYIKRGGKFTKTIFSEAELKRFFSTGKASSFGTIKEKQLNEKRKITYVIKSDILVLISKSKNTIKFLEVHDKGLAENLLSGSTAKSIDNGGQPSNSQGRKDCVDDCYADYLGDLDEGGTNGGCLAETVEDAEECRKQFQACFDVCPAAKGKPGNSINLYAITLKGLVVAIK